MRIGITERGDPAKDKSWVNNLNRVDGTIIITKSITSWLGNTLLGLHIRKFPVILHATCTGYGGTWMEPNVPDYKTQINSVKHLIAHGFPKDNIVLRIDPIIPTPDGLKVLTNVLDCAVESGIIPGCRVRISILDEYRHVKQRFLNLGHKENFPGRFTACSAEIKALTDTLWPYHTTHGMQFECCAEKTLTAPIFSHVGCVSTTDLELMQLPIPENMAINGQNRNGCLCMTCKYELLTQRRQCPHQCAYCFWKG